MSESRRSLIMRYSVTTAIGLFLVFSYASSFDLAELTLVEKYHVLCDAFSLPGILLILLGLLIKMNNVGALDTMAFGLSYLVHMFIPGGIDRMDSYLDFVEARREKRVKGYGFLFVVGFVLFGIAVIFLLLYFSES